MMSVPLPNRIGISVSILVLATVLAPLFSGCGQTAPQQEQVSPTEQIPLDNEGQAASKTGVLLVSHGSHSEQWRKMLLEIESSVRDEVLADSTVSGIKSAFMEYTEPSIATRLKEFDQEGFSDVVIIPILLTVSSHSFDDIPNICGQKMDRGTLDNLKLEGIEVYKPSARITLAPLLDFPSVLGQNVIRRVRAMSSEPADEGVVLVAYGSEPYDEEWEQLLKDVGNEVQKEVGVQLTTHSWCGHIVRYKTEPTEKAIQSVLKQKKSALVVPVLVAVDEHFQGDIIGGAIDNVDQGDRIRYRHDAILPDQSINDWVVQISHELASKIRSR